MDLSKLPRLSNSENPPPAVAPAPVEPATPASATADVSRPVHAAAYAGSFKAEAWIAIAVGVIVLLMFPRFSQWVSHTLFHTYFNDYLLPDGTVVPYTQVHDLWPDLGCTFFGLVLIVEGLALAFATNKFVLWGTLAIALMGTGYNLGYLITSFSQYGLAIVSALAVAFGAYLIVMHWQLIQGARGR